MKPHDGYNWNFDQCLVRNDAHLKQTICNTTNAIFWTFIRPMYLKNDDNSWKNDFVYLNKILWSIPRILQERTLYVESVLFSKWFVKFFSNSYLTLSTFCIKRDQINFLRARFYFPTFNGNSEFRKVLPSERLRPLIINIYCPREKSLS